MTRLVAALALATGMLAASPASASTIPDVGLRARQVAVTAGLVDASVDYAVLDRLQLGAGAFMTLVGMGAYGRATWRMLDDTPLGDVGLHLAAGAGSGGLTKEPQMNFVFLGPVIARPIGSVVVIRASLGVMATDAHNLVYPAGSIPYLSTPTSRSWGLGISDNTSLGLGPLVPNLEVAFRLGANHELTLGGNAIAGWRGRF